MSEKNPTPVENDKGESATVPPAESDQASDKTLAAPAAEETEVTFVVPEGLPFMCTALHLPQEDGTTLVIDREGAHVPSADLEALQEQASANGVLLNTEVSD